MAASTWGAVAAVAAILLVACDPADDGESLPTPDPFVTSENSARATSSTTRPMSAAVSVTVTPSVVAGWWDGHGWVAGDETRPVPIAGGEIYSILGLTGPVTTARGSEARYRCETDPATSQVEIPGIESGGVRPGPIAVMGVDNPRPRSTSVLDPAAVIYRQEAGRVLAQRGIDDPDADVVQALRTDLEGDGTDEVVVVAERIADTHLYARRGDYSFVLLRRLVNDALVTTVVAESVPDLTPDSTPFILSHRVSAIADLNGDGRMEVVLENRQYEGAGVSIHELQPDGAMREVLAADCGA